ncbi:prosaposin isoform X2 [Betta splendens]|uniref:Prosaposin isoform X2 n=1 Tax=Betta splendens TaxID=158456 RepID=A0A6P7P4A5_BETSP|nr:prosaposin isoform X2 [Betta splendens]
MALLQLTLLLAIGFHGCASSADVWQRDPDALRVTPNGDVCHDCTQIFELIADLLSNADFQKKMIAGVERLCDLLPGETKKLCKDEVEKMLPFAITFITGVAKPAQLCKVLGLCAVDQETMRALLLQANWISLEPENQCSFCILFVKTLEGLLPKERTESAITKVLEEVCRILPSTYKDQCEAVVDRFTKAVLDALMHYATPQTICALLHLCHGEDAAVDPCTLATYRCRDVKTSVQCGTLFYCQRFAWKSLNHNTI